MRGTALVANNQQVVARPQRSLTRPSRAAGTAGIGRDVWSAAGGGVCRAARRLADAARPSASKFEIAGPRLEQTLNQRRTRAARVVDGSAVLAVAASPARSATISSPSASGLDRCRCCRPRTWATARLTRRICVGPGAIGVT